MAQIEAKTSSEARKHPFKQSNWSLRPLLNLRNLLRVRGVVQATKNNGQLENRGSVTSEESIETLIGHCENGHGLMTPAPSLETLVKPFSSGFLIPKDILSKTCNDGAIGFDDTWDAPSIPITETTKPPDLFAKTPAELRNRIFEDALVSNEILDMTNPEPNLSKVSRKYRGEVLGIYYRKNIFHCTVSDYRHAKLRRVHTLETQYGPLRIHFDHDLTADTATLKANLTCWLHAAFKKDTFGLGTHQYTDDWFEWSVHEDRVARLFSYSQVLRDIHHMEWKEACELVARFLEMAGVCMEPGSEELNW
ncbi:hypothetical protein E2P81_ATG06342 [Venturia nashicola]|nr:hypothetical protein E2P81_ATG06342 [Venturia nashicola]